uniref:Uncharacterized protein n=1 Tax=Arundo donax TaxID=35708 RepID=A0A0A9E320_ARUDO
MLKLCTAKISTVIWKQGQYRRIHTNIRPFCLFQTNSHIQ